MSTARSRMSYRRRINISYSFAFGVVDSRPGLVKTYSELVISAPPPARLPRRLKERLSAATEQLSIVCDVVVVTCWSFTTKFPSVSEAVKLPHVTAKKGRRSGTLDSTTPLGPVTVSRAVFVLTSKAK